MDYSILLSIIALIISSISILFVVLNQGVGGMGLGFRESEATCKKRKEILEALTKEIEKDIGDFFETYRQKDLLDESIKEEIKVSIDDLSDKHYRISSVDEFLESTTDFFNKFIKNISLTTILAIVTAIFLIVEYPLMNLTTFVLFGTVFAVITFMTGYSSFKNLKWYYINREAFLSVSENPTLKNVETINKELDKKEIPIVWIREDEKE